MRRKNGQLNASAGEDRAFALRNVLPGLIPLIPLWIGLGLVITDTFPSAAAPWWAAAAAGLVLSAVLLILRACPVRRWVSAAGLALTAILCLAFRKTISGGLHALINDVTARLTAADGRIRLEFADAGSAWPVLAVGVFLLALLLSAAAARGRVLPVLPVLLVLAAGTAVKAVPVGAGLPLAVLGALLLAGGRIGSGRQMVLRAGAVVLCAAAALLIGALLRNADVSGWQASATRKIHALRYDNGTNVLPEGRLADLGPRKKSNEPALEVTMETPQKLYLRGHVYETYTGSAWEEIPAEELAESEDLFYWLHEHGFYGQTQVASAMAAAGEIQTDRITVKNLSACSEVSYLPYALTTPAAKDENRIGDVGSDRKRTDMTAYAGSVAEWYAAQLTLAGDSGEEAGAYLAAEQSYQEYVRGKDLQMTQESWNVLYRQLGEASGTHSLYEIQTKIRDWLEQNLHYDETVHTLTGSGDFLRTVLETGDGGAWSVAYATAATLMLRYYGVPARYVEGYYLTPEQAAQSAAGETVVLTEENAHAWAEYYLNGVGFIPFEVTPGYVDPDDLDLNTGNEGEGSDSLYEYESNPMSYAQTEEPDVQEPEVGKKDSLGLSPLTLLALIPLAALALLIFIVTRRLRLKRKLKEIGDAEDRAAVAMRYGYAMALKERAGGVILPEDGGAAKLNELAVFSPREITADDRKWMEGYADSMLNECRKTWGIFRRLKLRLIEGIY